MNDGAPAGVVEAVAKLGFYLPVDAACLGTTTTVSIGEITADVVLPNLTVISNDLFYVSAPDIQSFPRDTDWEARFQDHCPWGNIKSYRRQDNGDPYDVAVWLGRVLIRIPVTSKILEHALDDANNLSGQLNKDLQGWLSTMGDWFEVVSATYLPRSPKPGGNQLIPLNNSQSWFFDGTKATSLNYIIGGRPASGIGGPIVDLAYWRRILAALGKGVVPPDEHLLLRDSLEALWEERPRRSILDSATAAEISLAALLDINYESASESERQELRKANNSIMRMTRTLRQLGVSLSADIKKGLAECRDKAIHTGSEPSLTEARLAHEIATEIVEMASPKAELLCP